MSGLTRRQWLGGVFAGVASGTDLIVRATDEDIARFTAPLRIGTPIGVCPHVRRAQGRAFIVGVATETVGAGDLVEIQIYGPATARLGGSLTEGA